MNRLWTATYKGDRWVLDFWRSGKRWGISEKGELRSFDTSTNFHDLREMKLVPITAQVVEEGDVVIEGVTAEKLSAYLREGYRGTDVNEMYSDYSMQWNDGINAVLAQLAPSATQEGGAGEELCGVCKSCHVCGGGGLNPHFSPCVEPTPTATIELTEFKQHIADMKDDARIARRDGGEQLAKELEHFADVFESYLNPPLIEEPQEFGAVLTARSAGKEKERWVFDGENWIGETSRDIRDFSDLINPIRVEGKE